MATTDNPLFQKMSGHIGKQLVFKQYGGKTYKFVSQATAQNADAVRLYIDQQKGVDLYIDRDNPANYYFELPFV